MHGTPSGRDGSERCPSGIRQGILDVIYGCVLALIAALLMWESTSPRYADTMGLGVASDPAFYPQMLLAVWLALSAMLVAHGIVRRRSGRVAAQDWRLFGMAVAVIGAYAWLIVAIGFLLASVAMCAALMLAAGYRNRIVILTLSLGLPIVTWYVFERLLQIPLPKSSWFGVL